MEFSLNPDEQNFLLTLARKSISDYLQNKSDYRESGYFSDKLSVKNGAFVTLHTGNQEPRVCIGYVEGFIALQVAIHQSAQAAAFNDPRFNPVRADELEDIQIEISVLSPLRVVTDISEIEVGRDGLLIRKPPRSGLLLPQVAGEYSWDRQTFLEQTCRKAGLPKQSWQDKETQIFSFSAFIFREAGR